MHTHTHTKNTHTHIRWTTSSTHSSLSLPPHYTHTQPTASLAESPHSNLPATHFPANTSAWIFRGKLLVNSTNVAKRTRLLTRTRIHSLRTYQCTKATEWSNRESTRTQTQTIVALMHLIIHIRKVYETQTRTCILACTAVQGCLTHNIQATLTRTIRAWAVEWPTVVGIRQHQ